MKVYIITEGGSKVGFGHIARCTSLYYAFKEKDIDPCFIINSDDSIRDFLNKKKSIVFDWIKCPEKLYEIINNGDVAIIDSYLIDDKIAQEISRIVKNPVFIDDNQRLSYPRGIIINGSVHAMDLNYPKRPELIYLLGTQFCLIKKEFWERPTRQFNVNIRSIMITFGGNDIRNITPKLVEVLNEKYPNINKKVVIGRNYQNIKEILKAWDKSCELIYYPNTKKIKTVMLDSDIAITAGGQTTYELASMGVPSITIAIANNQINNVRKLNKLNIALYAGWWKDKNLFKQILKLIQKINNLEIRKKIVNNGFEIIKPDGSRRVIKKILETYKDNEVKIKN